MNTEFSGPLLHSFDWWPFLNPFPNHLHISIPSVWFVVPYYYLLFCTILKYVFLALLLNASCLVGSPPFIVTPSGFRPQGGDTKYTFILIFQLEWVQCNTETLLSKQAPYQNALQFNTQSVPSWTQFETNFPRWHLLLVAAVFLFNWKWFISKSLPLKRRT